MSVVIEGERIFLRDAQPEDATERYVAWLNDSEVGQFLETRFRTHTAEDIRRYIVEMNAREDSRLLAIVRRDDGLHLGNLRIGDISSVHRSATVALVLGEKSAWGHGFGAEAIALATRFAFESLGLHKLTARCYAPNVGSVKAFLAAGWTQEGVQREQFICDGRYVDGIWLGIAAAR